MICMKCGKDKNNFRTGRNKCLDCTHSEYKEWAEKNKLHLQQRGKEWREENYLVVLKKNRNYGKEHSEERKAYMKKWREEHKKHIFEYSRSNPEYKNIKSKLHYHVRAGNIIKSDACEICGSKINIQAHHQDYSKPLSVNWLCKWCHERVHAAVESVIKLAS